jgi:hypothetical protein
MNVAPFRARDYLEAYAAGPCQSIGDPAGTAEALERDTVGFTGRLQGVVLACAGITVQWEGLGVAWAILSPLGRQHPLLVHRAVMRGLEEIIGTHKLRRVECAVARDFLAGRRWVEVLGFEPECECPAYLPDGSTAIRYVRLL